MKIKIFVVVLCSFFLSTAVSAQEKKLLGLQEAVDLSLKNSKQLKASQAKIEEATAAVDEAKEKKLPSAGVNGAYMRIVHADIEMKAKNNSGGGTPAEQPAIHDAIYG